MVCMYVLMYAWMFRNKTLRKVLRAYVRSPRPPTCLTVKALHLVCKVEGRVKSLKTANKLFSFSALPWRVFLGYTACSFTDTIGRCPAPACISPYP